MLLQTLLAFGTIFPIVNPFSTALIFNKLSHGFSAHAKRSMALKAGIASTAALIVFSILGSPIMTFFGVTVYAFRAAGGIYLVKVGLEMLAPEPRRKAERYQEEKKSELAIIPLAIPLLAGPGALTSVLVLSSQYSHIPVLIAIILVGISSWIILRHAQSIQNVMGHIGTSVLERILGLIVLVVAMQFLFSGIEGFLAALNIIS